MKRLRLAALAVIPLVVVAAAAVIATQRSGQQPSDRHYEATGTVLESPEHGPELCLGGVAESLPPQCGGLPLVGWDWDSVSGEESRSGTTWMAAHVVGTYDGERFTLTEQPGPPQRDDESDEELDRFRPACDDPKAVDPNARSAQWADSTQAEGRTTNDIPGVSAVWVSDKGPHWDGPFVANVIVRPGHAQQAETFLRKYWDGYLCVVERDQRTAQELDDIHNRLADVLTQDILFSAADYQRGVVEATIVLADDQARREVNEAFGEGAVELTGALRPVD